MRKTLLLICFMALAAGLMSSCVNSEKIYYSHRGKVKHTYKRRYAPWYTFGGGKYSHDAKRTMKDWGRQKRY